MGKILYRDQYKVIVHYKNGRKFTEPIVRFNMKYGEPPGEEIEMFSHENIDRFIATFGHFIEDSLWIMGRCIVISGNQLHYVRNIDMIEVIRSQIEVSPSTRISELARELGYKEYMQFVYDTEKKLKSVIEINCNQNI